MDWLDLLTGTLNSLLQKHGSKASILQFLALFIVQLSHPYMTSGKTKAFTRWTFVGKVMSLSFFFYYAVYVGHSFSSKEQASFNFRATVTIFSDFGAQEIKSVTVSVVSPSVFHEAMGLDATIFIF